MLFARTVVALTMSSRKGMIKYFVHTNDKKAKLSVAP